MLNHQTVSQIWDLRPESPPCGRRVSPIQVASCHLQSGHGECLPATQLYLSIFNCPTVSLDLPSDAGEVLPARQLYLFHPTAGETYPSRPRVYPVGRRRGAPGQTILLSLSLPVQHAGEVLPARQTLFRLLAPQYRTPSNATYLVV